MASVPRPEFVRCRSGQTIPPPAIPPAFILGRPENADRNSKSDATNVHFQIARYRVHLQNLSCGIRRPAKHAPYRSVASSGDQSRDPAKVQDVDFTQN
jgi:hypothetical protein